MADEEDEEESSDDEEVLFVNFGKNLFSLFLTTLLVTWHIIGDFWNFKTD